jgi:uncharacterized protein
MGARQPAARPMLAMPAEQRVASPCIQVCRLDADQVCAGCGRTLDEIAEWSQAGAQRQREIVAACARRLRERPAPAPHHDDGPSR